jgi:hypothetical protein
MLDYIKENCKLPPLANPLYDEDSDTWDLWFETPEPWDKDAPSDTVCLPFETLEEANETLKQALELYYEEDTKENQETTR